MSEIKWLWKFSEISIPSDDIFGSMINGINNYLQFITSHLLWNCEVHFWDIHSRTPDSDPVQKYLSIDICGNENHLGSRKPMLTTPQSRKCRKRDAVLRAFCFSLHIHESIQDKQFIN